ncbi:hypothetical protein [Donghicola sp. XS_ASV15]|uniref:hypothetical protein n=1 Tax=Donghicola sp. XS_ASV15 TaxID=3241295 RepID=UPI003516C160
MKQTLIVATLMLLPFSALAQDQSVADPAEPESGFERMQRGFGMIFDGLREEVDPTVESLKDKAREMAPEMRDWVMAMGPALRDLADKIGDLNDYHAPEKLPNGDIILRRKEPMPDAPDAPQAAPMGPTDI